ncbi:unnamed protein product, partial [Staurois parvus]
MSAVPGHLMYYVCSLWSSPVVGLQSPVIFCTVSAVSDHLLYCVCHLWSSSVLTSTVSDHLLYYVCSF